MGQVETHWLWKLKDMISAPLDKIIKNTDSADKSIIKAGNSLAKFDSFLTGAAGKMLLFNQAAQGMANLKSTFDDIIAPGAAFNQKMSEVSSLTGVVGDELEKLGSKAKKTNLEFGGGASNHLENYKLLISKLGPDVAKSDEAMSSMGRTAAVLSKSMSNDLPGATTALTTGMLQFGVSLKNPLDAAKQMEKQMNVMSAAAKEGSAEVPAIFAAMEQGGVAAFNSKLSFEEFNAAVQELDRGGKKGAEGGTALRNVLMTLEKGRFLPKETLQELKNAGVDVAKLSDKTIPFTDRLRALNKIQNDSALMTQLFGMENANAANILLRSVDAQDALKVKITGTNSGYEQAQVIMGSYNEKVLRQKAFLENLGIAFFNVTQRALPFVSSTLSVATGVANIAPAMSAASSATNWLKTESKDAAKWILLKAKALATGALGMVKYGATALWTAIKGIGSFIINLVRGNYLVIANASFMLKYGVPALGRYMVAQASTGLGAIRMGAAFLWNTTMALPGMIAGLGSAAIAQLALNAAMYANPIGVVIVGLMAVGAAIALVITYWDEIKSALLSFGTWIVEHNPFAFMIDLVEVVFPGFKQSIKDVFMSVIDWFGTMWESIKGVWNSITSFFGFDGGNVEVLAPTTAGADQSLLTDLNTPVDPTKDNSISKGLNDISGGSEGGQVRNVKVSISKLVGIENFNTTNIQQGLVNFKEELKRVMIEAVRDAEFALASE